MEQKIAKQVGDSGLIHELELAVHVKETVARFTSNAAMAFPCGWSMTPGEAFAAIALAAIACDGSMDRQEAVALRGQLNKRTPFRDLSDDSMGSLFDRLIAQIRDQGWESLINEALPQLTLSQQETALAMAAMLVHCDRVVDPAEDAMLRLMANQLKLPEGRAAQILDVINVLSRDSLASN